MNLQTIDTISQNLCQLCHFVPSFSWHKLFWTLNFVFFAWFSLSFSGSPIIIIIFVIQEFGLFLLSTGVGEYWLYLSLPPTSSTTSKIVKRRCIINSCLWIIVVIFYGFFSSNFMKNCWDFLFFWNFIFDIKTWL